MNDELKDIAQSYGTDFFGVADLKPVRKAVLEQGGEVPAAYPYCISLGIALNNTVVDLLPNRKLKGMAAIYRNQAYNVINQRLDHISSRLASYIQGQGYSALPLPASERADDERICAIFSHKLGAASAGLGWIGKSCLLVTPQNGPRVRFTSVLTDAPVEPTGSPMAQKCGDCCECVKVCPVQAFTGRAFSPDEPRESRYDAKKCEEYFTLLEQQGRLSVCGMCLYICPYGRKNGKNGHKKGE